jgi:hypothetical protein
MDRFTQPTLLGGSLAIVILLVVLVASIQSRRPRRLDRMKIKKRWQETQTLCKTTNTWPLAIINADKLLDEVLKRLRCKGKTMGERLVSVQRRLSDNDSVWYGHKLRNRIVHEEMTDLKQRDVEAALRGFRQALKDLGALE